MNHCPECRAGRPCTDAQVMQAVAQAKPILLCPEPGCGQYATSHQPGDQWCGRRG